MRFSSLLQAIRHLLWRATPRAVCLRDIERDYHNLPDAVFRLLPDPPHGDDPTKIHKGLATVNYDGGGISIWDIRKWLWYLEQRGRVVKFFDVDDRIFVFVRLAR